MTKIINKDEFKEVIKTIAVVDFFATWCGPCKMFAPIFEDLATEIKDINFVKVDIDQEEELSDSLNIEFVPTIVLFKNGTEFSRFNGQRSKENVANWLKTSI